MKIERILNSLCLLSKFSIFRNLLHFLKYTLKSQCTRDPDSSLDSIRSKLRRFQNCQENPSAESIVENGVKFGTSEK